MKIFKKEKEVDVSIDAVAKKLAGNIMARQRQLADFLNNKTSGFSCKAVAYTLISFCIAFGGYCTYLLIDAIIK